MRPKWYHIWCQEIHLFQLEGKTFLSSKFLICSSGMKKFYNKPQLKHTVSLRNAYAKQLCPLICFQLRENACLGNFLLSRDSIMHLSGHFGKFSFTGSCLNKIISPTIEPEKSLSTWLGECCGQVEAEEGSNSRNKIHLTTNKDFFRALYINNLNPAQAGSHGDPFCEVNNIS